MAVIQEHKQKVQPVLDYRELNDFVEVFATKAEVCVCAKTQRIAVTRGQCIASGSEKCLPTNPH